MGFSPQSKPVLHPNQDGKGAGDQQQIVEMESQEWIAHPRDEQPAVQSVEETTAKTERIAPKKKRLHSRPMITKPNANATTTFKIKTMHYFARHAVGALLGIGFF
jgi:hypothetical protein